MSATLDTSLDFYSKAFLISAVWLEATSDPQVYVLDMDLEMGSLSLYGDTKDTTIFKQNLKTMMDQVIDPKEVEHWRM